MKKKKNKKTRVKIFLLILLLSAGGLYIFISFFKIKTVDIVGIECLKEEEIKEELLPGGIYDNPIMLFLNYTFLEKKEIPFVEDYKIEIKSLDDVKITVYEKSIVGYLTYMGTYMYFDKDGIVVENSMELIDGIPRITGIDYDHIVLYSKIPVKRDDVFQLIMNVSQLISKYKISVKKINITKELKITLYINQFRVNLGDDYMLSEKISTLSDILPNMDDTPGELDMTIYNNLNTGYSFKKD